MITAMPRIAIAVRDFEDTVATFREALGMPVIDLTPGSVESLGARLAMCVPPGGSNIEIMSPADPEAPLSQSLQGFLDRRGEGLFALMLEAPDPDAEAEELLDRGLAVLPLMEGAGGRDIHPKSTHGVLIRVYPDKSFDRRSDEPSKEPKLSGIARVIIAVHDAASAADVYGRGLGLDVSTPHDDEERGVRVVVCRPASGGQIELVSPVDGERPFAHSVAEFLDERREGMYALVLETGDPEAALERFRAQRGGPALAGHQLNLFGTRLHLEASAS